MERLGVLVGVLGLLAATSCSKSDDPIVYGGRPGTPDAPPFVAGAAYGHDLAVHTELGRVFATEGLGLGGFRDGFALARQPASGDLYGISAAGELVRIERDDARTTLIGSIGAIAITSLVFDDATGVLFATDFASAELVELDPTNGDVQRVGPFGLVGPLGQVIGALVLADSAAAGELFATYQVSVSGGPTQSMLVRVDASTGAATPIGALPGSIVTSLVFDASTGHLFAFDLNFQRVLEVDPADAAVLHVTPLSQTAGGAFASDGATQRFVCLDAERRLIAFDLAAPTGHVVGSVGFARVDALACDPTTDTLFAVDARADVLLSIDRSSGAGTLIGPLGFTSVDELAFDHTTERLVGIDTASGRFVEIDRSTGAASAFTAAAPSLRSVLACHPTSGVWYGLDPATGVLATIDPITGTSTAIGSASLANAVSFAFEPDSARLFGLVGAPQHLVEIDIATGVATSVGALALSLSALEFDATTGAAFGVTFGEPRFVRVDPLTAVISGVGRCPFDRIDGLALDPFTNDLYGTDTVIDQLVCRDAASGTWRNVGPLGFQSVLALAYDVEAQTLFGVDLFNGGRLVAIDTATGAATAVGAPGVGNIQGLAYDVFRDALLGVDASTSELVRIDRTTAARTVIGPLGIVDVQGLAFDLATLRLLGTSVATRQLVAIDRTTGAATVIGGTGFEVRGLAERRP